ncbi:MAG TPA: HNH endonuclease, partial [Idiomarina baltica]|nr:HNH endonuclease [Idiomarina baltica]
MRVAPFIITLLALWLTTDSSLVSAQTSANDVVKQSRSGICHTPSSPYY